jgi:hypothetical protein
MRRPYVRRCGYLQTDRIAHRMPRPNAVPALCLVSRHVVRMAKLTAPYFREPLPLTAPAVAARELVERSMEDRREGGLIAEVARASALFRGLDDGGVYHLARLGRSKKVPAGELLIRRGEVGDRLYLVLSGLMQVRIGTRELGRIGSGHTAGEMAILDAEPRSADVVALEPSEVVEMLRTDLLRLMDRRPRLGSRVMRNLAVDLAAKLRSFDVRYAESPEISS